MRYAEKITLLCVRSLSSIQYLTYVNIERINNRFDETDPPVKSVDNISRVIGVLVYIRIPHEIFG